jgi:hypothetical protein
VGFKRNLTRQRLARIDDFNLLDESIPWYETEKQELNYSGARKPTNAEGCLCYTHQITPACFGS